MAEPNSEAAPIEQSENETNNVNSKAQSNGKNGKGLRKERNSSNVNKNITTKRTAFKSTDVLVKSEGSTNPIGHNRNSSYKSSEIKYISEDFAEEEMEIEESPPLPPPPPPPQKVHSTVSSAVNKSPSPPKKKGDSGSSDSEESDQHKSHKKQGFKGFPEGHNKETDEVMLDLFDREEIELIQAQVVNEEGGGLDIPITPSSSNTRNTPNTPSTSNTRNTPNTPSTSNTRNTPPSRKRKRNEEVDPSSESTSPSLSITSQISILSLAKRSKNGSPGSKTSRKSSADLTHPKFLVPFEYGWRREVVTRGITSREDGICKDVYYFHPAGRKLRSLREVNEKLTPGLCSENFTFYKEPIGAQPSYETVRNARTAGQSPGYGPRGTPIRRPRRRRSCSTPIFPSGPGSNLPEATPPSCSKAQTDESGLFLFPTPVRPTQKCNRGTPKIALKGPVSTSVNGGQTTRLASTPKPEGPKPHPDAPAGPRRKITPRKKISKPDTTQELTQIMEPVDVDMEPVIPYRSPTGTSGKSSSNESLSWSHLDEKRTTEEGEQDYCTIRCTNAMGLIPTLQCSICLCIYHPDCCDMGDITAIYAAIRYICENCQAKSPEFKERGLLKHITPAVVTCEKSPPIISPKPIHPVVTYPVIPSAPLASKIPQIRPRLPSSNSFRGVPTWLPPPNRVFRSPSIPTPNNQRPEGSSSPPQSIVNLNSKRYIVVPKRSIFPVAPDMSTSPTKPESAMTTTTIITPTPTSTIIEGPPLQNNPFIRTTDSGFGMLLFPLGTGKNPDDDADADSQYLVNPITGSSAIQRCGQPDLPIGSDTLDHFARIRDKVSKRSTAEGVDQSMQKFMRNICIGYTALLHVFQYLKVQELLRAGRVCRLWRDIAGHSSLWRIVRMKNSQVSDWKGFTDSLIRHQTKFLDLRKMLVSLDETEEMWTTFAKYIANVKSLEGLEMCRSSVRVIEQIIQSCPQLLIFNAQMIGVKEQTFWQKLKVETLTKMKKLQEIRLKSCNGLILVGSLRALTDLAGTLTVLSLTSIKNLGFADVHYIGKLKNLEVLELGECTELPEDFPSVVIAKLQNLKRIRFEKGPSRCTANEMLGEMQKLKELVQLELINFDIRPGFDEALAACQNIKRLLLIPTYVTQSATTNNIILSGALKRWKNLTHFVWVLTMELLKVTELFVDQCERDPNKKEGGVPVLKPVPKPEIEKLDDDMEMRMEENDAGSKNPAHTPITVIPIDELYEMVTNALPNTRVKLLKVPFQNTWRQNMAEGSV